MWRFKFPSCCLIALLCAFLASMASASTPSVGPQPIIGSLDWVDHDTILGWACVSAVPDVFVTVDLWAFDTSSSQMFFLGSEFADRGRADVGGAGVCGSGSDASYHGFERTIYPESLIASQGTYEIYAYVNGNLLPGTGTVSFATAGFPTSNIWRTDFNDPNQRLVSMVSCIWPFKGANSRTPASGLWTPENADFERLFLNAGATIYQPVWESAPGVSSGPNYCLRNDPANPASWFWLQSNSATNAASWPMSNYWVVSANNELAYSKTQSGPPSQSQPIGPNYKGYLFDVAMDPTTFRLGIDNRQPGYSPDDTPFLSLGAQMGRGVTGPLGWVMPTGQDTHLELQVRQAVQSPSDYHDIALYIEFMWGGYKRFIGISLIQDTQNRFHWNWNALESFWFPGGEFNLIGTQSLSQNCSLVNAQLPPLTPGAAGIGEQVEFDFQQFSIPLRGVLECLEDVRLKNRHAPNVGTLGWQVERPRDLPLAITGIQIAIEQAPCQPDPTMPPGPCQSNAHMVTEFTKPTLVNH